MTKTPFRPRWTYGTNNNMDDCHDSGRFDILIWIVMTVFGSFSCQFAHRECIQRWCEEKGNTTCEICLQVSIREVEIWFGFFSDFTLVGVSSDPYEIKLGSLIQDLHSFFFSETLFIWFLVKSRAIWIWVLYIFPNMLPASWNLFHLGL